MNIEQSKTVPISVILNKMGLSPHRTNERRAQYFSALRKERTPSLFVNLKTNRWRDYGDQKWKGGDPLDLVCAYLDSLGLQCATIDGLRWLNTMVVGTPRITPVIVQDHYTEKNTLVFMRNKAVANRGLLNYAESRGINLADFKADVQEVYVKNTNTGNVIISLGMKNESKGWEVRNPGFKGCVGRKDITFLRGLKDGKPHKAIGIHIFEGFMDYLSVITQRQGRRLEDDVIVMHSLNMMDTASTFLMKYGYERCHTWTDNDKKGLEAVTAWKAFCKTEPNLRHVPMNKHYNGFKDVNEAHVAKRALNWE